MHFGMLQSGILEIVILNTKSLQIPQNIVYEKCLRTRNCRRRFIKNLLPENAKKTCKPDNRDLNRG